MQPIKQTKSIDLLDLVCDYWTVNGTYHRVDGPAIVMRDKHGIIMHEGYFINNKPYTKEEFNRYFESISQENKEILSDLGQSFD